MKIINIFLSSLFLLISNISFAQENISIQDLKKQYYRPNPSDIPFPKENPFSRAKFNLGKRLFFDPRLSRSKVMSCATCHNPSFSWADRRPKAVGDFHKEADRHTPTILNLAWNNLFTWDGRAKTLEEQALMPIESPAEMGLPLSFMIDDLHNINGYLSEFKDAFPEEKDPINKENVAKAIATFERTIISGQSPFDRWILGDDKAISKQAQKGFLLFNTKANCSSCHIGWNFTDNDFHDIGMKTNDLGRGRITGQKELNFAFKTPTLRNIAERFPYMHDGSLVDLEEVIDHYNHNFQRRKTLSDKIKPLLLTESEEQALIAFLKTLTSKDSKIALPLLP